MSGLFYKISLYPKDQRGVAATEFALIVPVLFLLMVGAIDFGTFVNNSMRLENTARAATQYVLQGGDPEDIYDDVVSQADLVVGNSDMSGVTVTSDTVCTCQDGEEVECTGSSCGIVDYTRRFIVVSINKEYETFMSYPGLPDSLNITKTIRLQVE